MPRTNRFYEAGRPYDICIRVRSGLPFPCLVFIKLLLQSAMARASRDGRITICHYLWMQNHLHMIVVMKDSDDCKAFYAELQKKLTDYVKRLLGIDHLHMWEGRPNVAKFGDLEKLKEKVAYDYANPSKANLVQSIELYPGLSSWLEFQAASKLDSTFTTEVPWIHNPAVPKVGARAFSSRVDQALADKLRRSSKKIERLIVEPNAWMRCFDLSDKDVSRINSEIIATVRKFEKDAETKRVAKKKTVVGVQGLLNERFFKPHEPKKKERRIFILSSIDSIRVEFIKLVKELCAKCRKLFKAREFTLWPPGMFRPPSGALASCVEL